MLYRKKIYGITIKPKWVDCIRTKPDRYGFLIIHDHKRHTWSRMVLGWIFTDQYIDFLLTYYSRY